MRKSDTAWFLVNSNYHKNVGIQYPGFTIPKDFLIGMDLAA